MELLPVELLSPILRMACSADAGITACALAATCQRTRQVIAGFRYENIALMGPHAICSFARLMYEHEGPTPVVKHLFLSDGQTLSGSNPDYMIHPAWSEAGPKITSKISNILCHSEQQFGWGSQRAKRRNDDHATQHSARLEDPHFNYIQDVIISILIGVSPTLTHLSLVLASGFKFPLVPSRMPALLELTYWLTTRSLDVAPGLEQAILQSQETYNRWMNIQQGSLPALQRLHVVGNYLTRSCYHMQAVPRQITHLRFSNEVNAEHLLRLLSAPPLNRWPPMISEAGSWAPPQLRRVLIHPKPVPSRYVSSLRRTLARWQDKLGDPVDHNLGKIARMVGNGEQEYTFLHAYEDWVDRTSGGPGSWND
jgi:hypothetical protein